MDPGFNSSCTKYALTPVAQFDTDAAAQSCFSLCLTFAYNAFRQCYYRKIHAIKESLRIQGKMSLYYNRQVLPKKEITSQYTPKDDSDVFRIFSEPYWLFSSFTFVHISVWFKGDTSQSKWSIWLWNLTFILNTVFQHRAFTCICILHSGVLLFSSYSSIGQSLFCFLNQDLLFISINYRS